MIKNIVFDIGNVLFRFDPVTYFTKVFNNEQRARNICSKIFEHEGWSKYDQGIFLLDDLYTLYYKEYPNDKEDIDAVLHNWFPLLQPMSASISYMKHMKEEGYIIYILSNISEDSMEYVKKVSKIFTYVQGAVLSFQEKVNKPDPRIYDALLHRYALIPKETIFIDDSKANILQANRMGIKGVQYIDDKQMKEDIQKFIVDSKEC